MNREPRSPSHRVSIDRTRGSAALLLLVIVLVLVGAGFLWVLLQTKSRAAQELAHAYDQARDAEPAPVPAGGAHLDEPLAGGGQRARPVGTPDGASILKSFEGTGSIRGHVFTPPGVPFPESWRLVVEPSFYLEGKEHAVRRVLDFTGLEREFTVPDLPLGGYRVFATAGGLECPPHEVPVFRSVRADGRTVSPTEHPYVMVELLPAGFVDGIVRDEAGLAVGGLPVTLENVDSRVRIATETQPDGTYLIEPVLAAEYRIYFGDPERPLIPAESILFARSGGSSENAPRPSLRYPDRVVPRTASILIVVVDEIPARVPDAEIKGFGNVGGLLEARTDANGEARLRYLPPGRYHLSVTHRSGRRGKTDFELAGDERDKLIEIMCKH
jgi:hypothetical protein